MIGLISRSVLLLVLGPIVVRGQAVPVPDVPLAGMQTSLGRDAKADWNRRLEELARLGAAGSASAPSPHDYRVGPDDLLAITVLEAPELSRALRVSAGGEIFPPLLGAVKAAGLTLRELELVLQELLRRTYMKDPHVSVTISEMQSHPISVMGAVRKPGVFQVWGSKTLLETLSMAEGLAEDAGETVVVMRGQKADAIIGEQATGLQGPLPASQAKEESEGQGSVASPPGKVDTLDAVEVSLKDLLDSGDSRYNVRVHPGDIVKVKRAGIVYIVGEVNKPGGFPLKNNETQTVLQALALGEGFTRTAAKQNTVIIRTAEDGRRTEIPIDLAKILKGKAPDVQLQARDIVFVPNSTGKSVARGSIDALVRMLTLRAVVY